jgi:hypothetical protein
LLFILNRIFKAVLISAAISFVRATPAETGTALSPQPTVPPVLSAIRKTFMEFPEAPEPGKRTPGCLLGSGVEEAVGEAVGVAEGVRVAVCVAVGGGVAVKVAVGGRLAVAVGGAGDRVSVRVATGELCRGSAVVQPEIIAKIANRIRIAAGQRIFFTISDSQLQ